MSFYSLIESIGILLGPGLICWGSGVNLLWGEGAQRVLTSSYEMSKCWVESIVW